MIPWKRDGRWEEQSMLLSISHPTTLLSGGGKHQATGKL